jgi:hypothetical protein
MHSRQHPFAGNAAKQMPLGKYVEYRRDSWDWISLGAFTYPFAMPSTMDRLTFVSDL